MFAKMFGPTEEDQMQFLNGRAYITLGLLVAAVIMMILDSQLLGLVTLAFMLLWSLPVLKSLLGITTLGAIFSGNFIVGLLLFVLYLVIGYFAGLIFAALGLGRWIYLMVKGVGRV